MGIRNFLLALKPLTNGFWRIVCVKKAYVCVDMYICVCEFL